MNVQQQENFAEGQAMLIRAINSGADGAEIGEDLFGVTDLLASHRSLRDGLTDPGRPTADKLALAAEVLGPVVSNAAMQILNLMVEVHWSDSKDLPTTINRLGLDAYILLALRDDKDVSLAEELIGAGTVIAENRDLRVQLSEIGEGKPADRAELARTVFHGRVSLITERLVVRAAYSSHFGRILQNLRGYAERASELTGRKLILAFTAKPLSADQEYRMAALASRQWNTAVEMITVVDPNLIGGFRLDAGDEAIDTSIRNDLASAKLALTR